MSTTTQTNKDPNLNPATLNLERIDVPKPLGEQEIKGYLSEGFAVVRGVVTHEEIQEVSRDIVKLLRGGYECPALTPMPDTMSDEEVMKSFLGVLQPHYISPVLMKYAKHPKICGILSQLAGAHIPYWDGSVKCMQSMIFTKPPGYPGQAWHQDELYIPTRDRSLIGAWVALDDATVQNGCLWVIPQSHRMGYLYPQRAHTRLTEWDFAPVSIGFDDAEAVPVEVKAGDCIFFHGYLLHASYMNRSEIYRRALVCHYSNAWSFLPWGLKEKEGVGACDRRKVVPVAGVDPYGWKGFEPMTPGDVWVRPLKQR